MRLLVVKDETDLRRALEKGLREEGYAVDSAADGDEGLFKAEPWECDLILLDVMLYVMDGRCWSVCAARERLRCSCSLPAIQ